MKLRDHRAVERERGDEPQPEHERRLALTPGGVRRSGHFRRASQKRAREAERRKRERHERDPRKHAEAELLDEVLDAAGVAVDAGGQTVDVIVDQDSIGEGGAVADVHRDEPRQAQRAERERAERDAQPTREQERPAVAADQQQQGDQARLREAGDTLGHERQPAKHIKCRSCTATVRGVRVAAETRPPPRRPPTATLVLPARTKARARPAALRGCRSCPARPGCDPTRT